MKPIGIHIETTAHCNAKCAFCPHKDMEREKGVMDMAMFMAVVEEARELGIMEFYPFLNGEPFTDPMFYQRLEFIFEAFKPDRPAVLIYSNFGIKIDVHNHGTLLQKCVLILSIADGVNSDVVESNIEQLRNANIPIHIHAVDDDEHTRRAAHLSYKYGLPWYPYRIYNWAGLIDSPTPPEEGYCVRPRQQMCVLWDGRVTLCCMTLEGDPIIGDVAGQTLEEIWHSPAALKYRMSRKETLEPCRGCNMAIETEGD